MRRSFLAIVAAGCSFHPSTPPAPTVDSAPTSTSAVAPRGVYVPTFGQSIANDSALAAALSATTVDGFVIAAAWKDVEPAQDAYDFETHVGANLRAVAAAGKRATISIGAGIASPAYVCTSAGATCLDLVVRFKQGNQQCIHETLPLPWDPVLQARFGKMVAAFGAYIAGDATLAQAVVAVKITGFNDHDEETILPVETGLTEPCTVGDACGADMMCHETDTVTAFQTAGYTSDVAVQAFATFAGQFRAAFPNVAISSQITSQFPALVGTSPPTTTAVPVAMVQRLIGDASLAPVTVQDNGLTATGGVDIGTVDAHAAGVPVGYQMLAYVANNAACLMAGTTRQACSESILRAAIDLGVTSGASWLEIYKQDIVAYPASIAYAHGKLAPS
jgi:hypothetical protein